MKDALEETLMLSDRYVIILSILKILSAIHIRRTTQNHTRDGRQSHRKHWRVLQSIRSGMYVPWYHSISYSLASSQLSVLDLLWAFAHIAIRKFPSSKRSIVDFLTLSSLLVHGYSE